MRNYKIRTIPERRQLHIALDSGKEILYNITTDITD